MFKLIYRSSCSACFELENNEIYYSDKQFNIILNGVALSRLHDANVFSVFSLKPDTEYEIGTTLSDYTLKFRTMPESVCLSVSDFGAKGDGETDDTDAVMSAVFAAPKQARITFPAGVYLVAPIVLKSNLTIELQKGAVLLGTTDESRYPIMPGEVLDANNGNRCQISSWEGTPHGCHRSLITAFREKNISIVGEGMVDGNAQNASWWIRPKERSAGRPRLLFMNACEDVTLHGISVRNSASWTLHPFFCKDFSVLDARIDAPADSPNTDGCDPESCDGVNIIGTIISVGDDCIAIKSGKRYMGETYNTPASRHTIRNCLMRFGHGAVVLGSEMSGGVRELSVSRCFFLNTDRGLRIKTRRGRGKNGVIDGVAFENIKMEGVKTPLVINMYYFCDKDGKSEYVQSREKQPVDDGTPYLGAFSFKNIVCTECEYAAGWFYGLPERPIKSVELENVSFSFANNANKGFPAMMSGIDEVSHMGINAANVTRLSLNNIVMDGVDGERVIAHNVAELEDK